MSGSEGSGKTSDRRNLRDEVDEGIPKEVAPGIQALAQKMKGQTSKNAT